MPRYTFENRVTGETKEEYMTIANMEQFLKDNPDWFNVIKAIGVRDNFVSSRHTNVPLDSDFKNMLQNMKNANKGSTIDW